MSGQPKVTTALEWMYREIITCMSRIYRHDPLDRPLLLCIIIFTYSHRLEHGGTENRDRQASRFTATRHAQSSLSGCAPSTVPGQRFLRPRRYGSGQVRDAPSGPCRQPADFPDGFAFGFSRPSFYQANATFEQAGLAGLVPLKRGPRSGHKLTPEVMAFLATKLNSEPSLKFHQLAALLKEEFDIQIHLRSIERQLLREKKRR